MVADVVDRTVHHRVVYDKHLCKVISAFSHAQQFTLKEAEA